MTIPERGRKLVAMHKRFAISLLGCLPLTGACDRAGNEPASRSSAVPPPVVSVASAPQGAPSRPPAPAPAPTAPFEGTAGIEKRPHPPPEHPVVLSGVRAGRHQGYDRVVFEFEGDQFPSTEVEYVDEPVRHCGSGQVAELAGDGWLELRFQHAVAHRMGKPTVSDREQHPKLPVARELELTCDFEGHVTWVIGVQAPNRYRLLELPSPPRVVVDILH